MRARGAFRDGRDFGETSCTGGSASLPAMSAYVRVSSQMACCCLSVGFIATEKTSLRRRLKYLPANHLQTIAELLPCSSSPRYFHMPGDSPLGTASYDSSGRGCFERIDGKADLA